MSNKRIKFNNKENKDFLKVLRKRINEYFESNGISQYANRAMWIKIIFWLGLWLSSYILIMTNQFSGIVLFTIALVHGLTHLFIAFNISHDANHNAISANSKVNRFLSYSLDLIGVNSYLWRILHNQEHHGYVNIDGIDTSIEGYGIIRFSPNMPYKSFFKYQHLYAPLIYGIITLNYVTIKDFRYFIKFSKTKKINYGEVALTIITKIFYYTYMIALPIIFLDVAWWHVVLMFFLIHFLLGLILAMIFQSGHLTEEAHFPHVDEKGNVDQNWALHVVETTGDFAARKPIVNWLFGGINIHVIHHILPHICHIHYPKLAPIIKETAEEFGLHYRDIPGLWEAFSSHFKYLKEYGRPPMKTQLAETS